MDLLQRRSMHFSGVSAILSRLLQDNKSVARGALFLDYESWVRNMVGADDLLEAADARQAQEARAQNRGGRMTRNSQRESYIRYVTLSDEQRRLVRDTAFRVGRHVARGRSAGDFEWRREAGGVGGDSINDRDARTTAIILATVF